MRNREVIRQWNLLRLLDANRHGATVERLAREGGVSTRTTWRDMAALQEAGFPLTCDREGKQTRWQLAGPPFKGLAELGISMVELCSLYMARTMVDSLVGAPFAGAMAAICERLQQTLPPKMRAFLDRLPALVEAKPAAVKKPGSKAYDSHLAKLIEACAEQRVCSMRYYSASSGATKTYTVHPYRLVHAHGGMYVLAWVPEYRQIRTFAVERVQTLSLERARFDHEVELSPDAFGHSLGVNRGTPERIVVAFASRIAAYVRERTWHPSQKLHDLPDGGVRMTLRVCVDAPLRTWILGFGPFVKVESPSWLAEEILQQIEAARDNYIPRLELALPHRVFAIDQPWLPGIGSQRLS